MSSITARPEPLKMVRLPPGLALRLLRLEYWYDGLTEPQRLLAGVAAIIILGSTWLYLLGLSSWVLVNRAQELPLGPGSAPSQSLVQVQQGTAEERSDVFSSVESGSTSAPASATVAESNLIQPPDVPEVPIVAAPPRAAAPVVQPLKPRVMATTAPAPVRQQPVATVAPTPTRSAVAAPQTVAPARTSVPANGSGTAGSGVTAASTPTPARTPGAGPAAAPTRAGATSTPGPTATRPARR